MQGSIDSVYDSVSIGREKVAGFAQELYKSGLRGGNLANALKAVSIAAAGGGDAAAEMAKNWVSGTMYGLGSSKKVLDRVNGLWGATVKAQMLSLSTQSERFHTSLQRLFTGINLDPILTGLKSVLDLFSTTTETGKALQFMLQAIFDPLAKAAGPTGLIVKRFFQGMVIAGLSFLITTLKIRNFIKDALGPVFNKLGIHMGNASLALWLGKAAGAALIGTLVLLSAVIGSVVAGITVMMSPMIATMGLIGVVIYGAIKAVGYLTDAFRAGYKWISGLNWGELGTNLVNGIVHGVKSGAQWVIDAVKNLGTGALEAFKSVLGIRSPSVVFRMQGIQMAAGAAAGVRLGTPRVESSVTQMGRSAIQVGSTQLGGSAPLQIGARLSFPTDVPSISSISNVSNAPNNVSNRNTTSNRGGVHIENINVQAPSGGGSNSPQDFAHEFRLALIRELSFNGVAMGTV